MSDQVIEVAAGAVLEQLACPPTEKNLATARRVAIAVLNAIGHAEAVRVLRKLRDACDGLEEDLNVPGIWGELVEEADAALALPEDRS